ncbi:MAG: hypothetical protein ACRERX_16290, partial [Pseudomonas sp.]
ERSRAAERALMDARARLNAAEAQLRQAQDEVADLRAEFERAGLDAKAIGLEVQEAERALEGAR